MIEKGDLFQMRKDIGTFIGQKVQLKSNKGRKKAFVREGIIENAYSSIFVVKFENNFENTRRVTFNYTDVLTKSVEMFVYKDNKRIQIS